MDNRTNKNIELFLMCVFGGWLGLHQFYVGNVKKGLIYMCTLGLFGFGWFIDIFLMIGNMNNQRWYNTLSETDKTKIKELAIRLKEINSDIRVSDFNIYSYYEELYDLLKHLVNEEEISFFMNVMIEDKVSKNNIEACIYITNKKILTIQKSRRNSKTIPFEKIDSIETGATWLMINDGSTTLKIVSSSKQSLRRLREEINKGMENHKNISIHMTQTTERDVADKIARLQVLYEEGVLTEYEFNMKKMELLDKVK